MSGGGGTNTTVQSADPWEGVQPHLTDLYDRVNTLGNQGQQYFPGQTYVDRDPLENQAQQMRLDQVGGMQGQVANAQAAQQQMLNAPDVANNQYVSGMADTITNRLNRNYTENLNPAIQHGAIGAGQMGSSRHGVAQGIAARGTQEALGDALSGLYGNAYSEGLTQQARGMATAGQTMNLGLSPANVVEGAGAYNRGQQELALQEEMARHNFEQQQPYDQVNWMNSIYSGVPWGSTATSTGGGGGGGGLTGALGGAALGASLAAPVGGMLASGGLGLAGGMGPSAFLAAGAANPAMWPLIIGGGLLGSGLF